ncbi:MAG: ISAs1 family transposase [Clostridium sp.]|nr:ISAs1 family transposase [Clostridium sp.]
MPAQEELQSLVVRPIKPEEEPQWNRLMDEHHYLGFRQLVGESMKYVAELNGQWVALLGWGTAAFKCGSRDEWIGWSREQQWRRLLFLANNARFLILPQVRMPNLASKILSLNLRRLSADWMAVFGHKVVLAETFVEHSRFAGTCYQAAGWIQLGQTRGFGRNGGKYYHHGLSKTIYVYPLHRSARQLLSAPFLAPELTGGQKPMVDLNKVNLGRNEGLLGQLQQLKDPRKRRGIRHSATSTLMVAVCAVLSGARNFLAIGEWAADLPQDLLRRLGCRFHPEKRTYIPPSEPTIRRHLQSVDADEFDRLINEWLAQQADPDAVAVDGKTLRGARDKDGKKLHLMSALLHKEGVVIAQKQVDRKTNEIPLFQPLLEPVDLKGKVVTADALHTQVEHATYLKEQKEADYFFTVKRNQGTLLKAIEDLEKEDFSP